MTKQSRFVTNVLTAGILSIAAIGISTAFAASSTSIKVTSSTNVIMDDMMSAASLGKIYTGRFSDVAVGGYDTVSFFDGDAVKGSKEHSYKYAGATWRFANVENLEKFKADPHAYAPQYGGHCAWAAAEGYTAKGDPKFSKIVDGKLYLNYNNDVQQKWLKDIPGFISKANANWVTLGAE